MFANKTVLVGIDGASFTLLKELMDCGVMPELKHIVEDGIFTRMNAPIPDNSAVSWSSIMTGANPGTHGIFGFTELIPETYTLRFPNFLNLQANPFWLQNPDKKYIIINLPFTYPAQCLNGILISGFVSPDLERAVYPSGFFKVLKENNYRIDADHKRLYESRDFFVDDLFRVFRARTQLYRKLFETEDWDVFMIVFTGSDRLGHYFIDAYQDNNEPYYSKFIEYYSSIDQQISWICRQLKTDDTLVMMSDHGMDRIRTEVNINTVLKQHNLLRLKDKEKPNYNDIMSGTKAFALEPSRIYLNYTNLYPGGTVNYNQRDSLIESLQKLFLSLEYEDDRVVEKAVRKEDVYTGEATKAAPDLILVQNPGFSLRASLNRSKVYTQPDVLTGSHNGQDAFLCIRSSDSKKELGYLPQAENVLNIIKQSRGKK